MSYTSKTAISPELNAIRKRAARRKSPWNLVLLVLAIIAVAASWIVLVQLFGKYRESLLPAGAFLSSGTRFANILMHVAPGIPSIAIGFVVANLLIWCIPPARQALEREDKQFPETDFKSSNRALLRMLVPLAIIFLPLAFLGARNLWSLTPESLSYQPMLSVDTKRFSWNDVVAINTGCYFRRNLERNFAVVLRDGTTLDLSQESPPEFARAYPLLQKALTSSHYAFDSSKLTGTCVQALSTNWTWMLSERPTPEP